MSKLVEPEANTAEESKKTKAIPAGKGKLLLQNLIKLTSQKKLFTI